MDELENKLNNLILEVDSTMTKLGLTEDEKEARRLKARMEEPDFWKDQKLAAELSQKESSLRKKVEKWKKLADSLDDLIKLTKLKDKSLMADIESEYQKIEKQFEEFKRDLRFSGPYDDHDVILNIYAGAGGTDAQDWAQMLERMYLRWAEGQGLKTKVIDESPGEEAGIKSATIEIGGGDFLYGKLAGEHGVHRLVRRSPFNSAASRETSFAKVDVLPKVDRPGEVELDDKDLKIDVFRAGGHGGQSVNTTDSAVRVTHLPTGITVAIQNERSQLQNKETALAILRSRLAQLQLEQHAETLADIKGPSQSNEFGSQIRNYILDDRILKDLRTGYETHDPQKVLDGGLEPLVDAWLEKG